MLSCIAGSIFAVDAINFVFGYLFVGVTLSLALSLVHHWIRSHEDCASLGNSACVAGIAEKFDYTLVTEEKPVV